MILMADIAGERLDAFLARAVPDLTRSAAQKLIEEGNVLRGGKKAKKNDKLNIGDEITVTFPEPKEVDIQAKEMALDIVYEDEDMVVINKQPGILIHPSHGHFDDTVGNYLMWHWQQRGEESGFHPVHRLDKGTTGLLIVAKHPHGQEKLKNQLHTGAFRRLYLAVCEGVPSPSAGIIDAPIGMVDGSLMQREVRPDGQAARPANVK